jgi:hypothetical protein
MKKKTSSLKRAKASKHKSKIRNKRPAHKKVLLNPATVFVLLCVGVLLIMWTWKTQADSYSVQAVVPAVLLTEPAVITSPSDGTKFTKKPITVNGSCPDNSYVKLYRNNVFSGVAFCSSKKFSIQTDLSVGSNKLLARVFNTTDKEGPTGNAVTVFYNPPAASTGNQPLVINSEYLHRGYAPNQDIDWQLSLSGGSQPYAVHIDWGDKNADTLPVKDAGPFSIAHSYHRAGNYVIEVEVTDTSGSKAYLQLTAVVKEQLHQDLVGAGIVSGNSPLRGLRDWLWLIWPSYLVLVLMVVSFWLGEREEYIRFIRSQSRGGRRS